MALSAQMRAAWTAFAARRPGLARVRAGERLVQVFDAESVVTADPEAVSRRIWADHAFEALGLLGA